MINPVGEIISNPTGVKCSVSECGVHGHLHISAPMRNRSLPVLDDKNQDNRDGDALGGLNGPMHVSNGWLHCRETLGIRFRYSDSIEV